MFFETSRVVRLQLAQPRYVSFVFFETSSEPRLLFSVTRNSSSAVLYVRFNEERPLLRQFRYVSFVFFVTSRPFWPRLLSRQFRYVSSVFLLTSSEVRQFSWHCNFVSAVKNSTPFRSSIPFELTSISVTAFSSAGLSEPSLP